MMDFSEARSFNDGIEFYGKDIIIIATRKDCKVNIEKSKSPRLKYSNKFVKTIICLLLTIISNLILNTFQDFKVQILLIIALFWSSVICFFFFNSRNDKNVQCYKYHAAEHKFLNYIDKYKKEPETCEDVMKMSSYSYRCGSTILVVIMTLLTLCICGILYIPTLILKILWIAFSIFITLYLWANNKCDFLQKFVVVEPSYSEVEVAFIGGKEYLKTKQNIS